MKDKEPCKSSSSPESLLLLLESSLMCTLFDIDADFLLSSSHSESESSDSDDATVEEPLEL